MDDNSFYSIGSSKNSIKIDQEFVNGNPNQTKISEYLSGKQKLLTQKNLSLADLDLKYKDQIRYFKPITTKINIDPQQCYEVLYACSTKNKKKFGILIKSQFLDLVNISQSYPDKTINELQFLATIYGIRYCIDLGIKILNVKGNSQLVTNLRKFQIQELAFYKDVILEYSSFFITINFLQIPTELNTRAKELSTEKEDFVRLAKELLNISNDLSLMNQKFNNQFDFQTQKRQQDQELNFPQNQSQNQVQRLQSEIQPQKNQLDQVILQYQDIFSEYENINIQPLDLEKDRDYALIFGNVDNTNRVANFLITQDLNEIIIGTFCFSCSNIAMQEISLIYGMRFLLESKITKLNCFTINENFCQLFENESYKLNNSGIKEQKCLYTMKQIFSQTKCKKLQSENLFKILQQAYEKKQSQFKILDESILTKNNKTRKLKSKTFRTFEQIYGYIL